MSKGSKYMKELSAQKILMPFVIILVAVIIVSLISAGAIKNLKSEVEYMGEELGACRDLLLEKQNELSNVSVILNTAKADVQRYDEIYDNKSEEADKLAEELEIEKEKEDTIIAYNIPARSVPYYKDYSKAAKLELMLELLNNADEIYRKTPLPVDDMRTVAGYVYLVSLSFDKLYSGSIPKGEDAYKLYNKNLEHLEELDGIYHYFDEQLLHRQKLKNRIGQLLILQRSVVEGMQSEYFKV